MFYEEKRLYTSSMLANSFIALILIQVFINNTIAEASGNEASSSSAAGYAGTSSKAEIKELAKNYEIESGQIWIVKDKIYKDGLKIRRITEDSIHDEVKNLAHSMVTINKYGEVDKRKIKMSYIIATVYQLIAHTKKIENLHILTIGLGGAVLQNFLGEMDLNMVIISVEISKTVIFLAEQYFGYKPDSDKQKLIQGDGIKFVHEAVSDKKHFDWIVVDAANGKYFDKFVDAPDELDSVKFDDVTEDFDSDTIAHLSPIPGFWKEEMAKMLSQLIKPKGILVINTFALDEVSAEKVAKERSYLKKIYEKYFSDCYFAEILRNENGENNKLLTCIYTEKDDKHIEKDDKGINVKPKQSKNSIFGHLINKTKGFIKSKSSSTISSRSNDEKKEEEEHSAMQKRNKMTKEVYGQLIHKINENLPPRSDWVKSILFSIATDFMDVDEESKMKTKQN